jgi:hypothetical protein
LPEPRESGLYRLVWHRSVSRTKKANKYLRVAYRLKRDISTWTSVVVSSQGHVRAGSAVKMGSRDVGENTPLASQPALDVPAQTPRTAAARFPGPDAGSSACTREPGLGLQADRRRACEASASQCRRPRCGRSSSATGCRPRPSVTSFPGATSSANRRRRRSPAISSPSRPPG